MEDNEKIPDYISRVIMITNKMKSYGETLSEQVIIEKVMRSLTPQFDYIVVEIECSKDLRTMRIKELQSSEAQEFHLSERTFERGVEHALKASFGKKSQKQSRSEAKKRHGGDFQKSEASNFIEKKHQKGKDMFDKKKVQRYRCKKFGHFAADCWSNKERKSEEENIARRDSDDEPVLLMASESDGAYLVDWWYTNTACSNHLIGNKQWLFDFDSRKRTKIKCADDKYLNTKGMGNVKVKVKNGKIVLIKDV
ncbi:uncharacterized protein LOC127115709 [Lathyrus oleraceus]|uniref:uncharacterized protein LOC127115709 n=1 Tax=Pisum sativum TaxID=3888 RepID=UPI0021D0C2F9|nr:uncharacterized protein LOC127115709 [Pisum sativum]